MKHHCEKIWTDSKVSIIFITLWAYLALMGIVYYLKIGIQSNNFPNNIIYLPMFFVLWLLIKKIYGNIRTKEMLVSLFISIFFSVILVIGAQIEYLQAIIWSMATGVKIVLLTISLVPFVLEFFLWYNSKYTHFIIENSKWTKKKIYLIIVCVWGLAYLALYPGIYDYDSIAQTLQFLVTKELSAHHPVVHSFILSGFLYIGDLIAGSYQLGLGLYSAVQLLFLAYVALEIVWFLHERKYKVLFYCSLIFFVCFPLHYIMAVWATKDIFFTGFFALLSLEMVKFFENKDEYWSDKYNNIKYILLVLLMCMFRNNGIYAILIALPVALICLKKQAIKMILFTLIGILLYFSYQNILLPALDVKEGNMREMLSIPCQQMAKVYVERPDIFSEEEKELLFELIPEKNLKDYQYRPMIADATKNFFDSETFVEEPMKYIKLYSEIGLRSPRKYIEAFLANSLGFWYPNKSYPDERMYHPYTEFEMADPNLFKGDYIYIERSSKIPVYENVLRKIILETKWTKLPVISNLFVPGTYFIMLCCTVMLCVYSRKWDKLIVLAFWAGFWLTLLISPVALVRYAYPIIFCAPLCGYIVFSDKK